MLPTLRLRRSVLLWRLRRRPVLWWALAALAATLTFLAVQASLGPAAGERCATTTLDDADDHREAETGSALARSMPPGSRAVAVPASGLLVVEAGDSVDLIAPGRLEVEGAATDARTVVEAALVVAVSDEAVTLAVPAADAPEVALAAGQGGAALAVVSTT